MLTFATADVQNRADALSPENAKRPSLIVKEELELGKSRRPVGLRATRQWRRYAAYSISTHLTLDRERREEADLILAASLDPVAGGSFWRSHGELVAAVRG
jgi:hypothetical protein